MPTEQAPITETEMQGLGAEMSYPTAMFGSIRILNLVDGDSVEGTYDENGLPHVMVQVEVSGATALFVYLRENGLPLLDEVPNSSAQDPFQAEIPWYPVNGGGDYTLVATALLDEKTVLEQSVHVTVTGVPVFTPTAPPLDQASAQRRISELILQDYGASIPLPSVFRFNDPLHPKISRWIGSAYYMGIYYYIDLFDDGHYAWSVGDYTDQPHPRQEAFWIICKPAGHYRILVVYVDYTGGLSDPQAAIADVQPVVDWMNNLCLTFAQSQGLSSSPLTIEAEGAFAGPPPVPGSLLTADQVLNLTGKDPAAYDILMEIDLDPQFTFAAQTLPGALPTGGGLALQGCGSEFFGAMDIYSNMQDASQVEGSLIMDFNHELSHVFGMKDTWIIPPYFTPGPSGQNINDWIPYPMFGWTDADGDGVIEILDPTPYGTAGPQP